VCHASTRAFPLCGRGVVGADEGAWYVKRDDSRMVVCTTGRTGEPTSQTTPTTPVREVRGEGVLHKCNILSH
jgi:hypothetical protein